VRGAVGLAHAGGRDWTRRWRRRRRRRGRHLRRTDGIGVRTARVPGRGDDSRGSRKSQNLPPHCHLPRPQDDMLGKVSAQQGGEWKVLIVDPTTVRVVSSAVGMVGWCTLKPVLKAPGFSA